MRPTVGNALSRSSRQARTLPGGKKKTTLIFRLAAGWVLVDPGAHDRGKREFGRKTWCSRVRTGARARVLSMRPSRGNLNRHPSCLRRGRGRGRSSILARTPRRRSAYVPTGGGGAWRRAAKPAAAGAGPGCGGNERSGPGVGLWGPGAPPPPEDRAVKALRAPAVTAARAATAGAGGGRLPRRTPVANHVNDGAAGGGGGGHTGR